MPLLNAMDKVYTGGVLLDAVYLGADKIWPAGPFAPTDISGMLAWFDATQLTGLAEGAAVTNWPDMSGNGMAVYSHYGSANYRTGAINGLAALGFGEADFTDLRFSPGRSVGSRTVFQVVKITGGPLGSYHTTQLQSNEPYMQTYSSGGVINTYSTAGPLSSGVSWSGNCQFVTVWCDTDGTQGVEVDGTKTTGTWTVQSSPSTFQIGANQAGGYGMRGLFGELLIYDRCLSDVERQQVQDYLTAKWAPPWTPADLSGLSVWHTAEDYVSGSWPNRGSGPSSTLVGTPAPTIAATPLNGKPVVRFTANEGRLRGTWATAVHDWTLVYLVRWVGPNPGRAFSAQYPPSNLLVGMHTSAYDAMYDNGTWLYGPAYGTWPTTWRMYGADSQSGQGMLSLIHI